MGTVADVVLDVLDEQCSELALLPDDRWVEEFVAEGADPSLGVRVRLWRARRDPYLCDPRIRENVVE